MSAALEGGVKVGEEGAGEIHFAVVGSIDWGSSGDGCRVPAAWLRIARRNGLAISLSRKPIHVPRWAE